MIADYDLRIIHLVRDIRPFIFSQQALHGKSFLRWAAYWLVGNRRREEYSKNFPKNLRVGHDELALEPELIIRKICNFIDVDYDSSMAKPSASNSHILFGNTVSADKEKASRIRYDYRWLLDPSNIALQHPFLVPLMKQNRRWVYANLFERGELAIFSSSRRKEIRGRVRRD